MQNKRENNKPQSKTEKQKEEASKARIAKRKEERAAKKGNKVTSKPKQVKETDKDWFTSAVDALSNFATKLTSVTYTNKREKYFNINDEHSLSLVRSAIGAKNTKAGIGADIATSKYPNQPNSRQIASTALNFTTFDEKKERITWIEIFARINEHQDKQTIVNSNLAKFARKVNAVANITNKSLNNSKDQIEELIEKKALVSREIAQLAVTIRNTSNRLGFFGWLFHPMQTYRNSCAKDLIKELKHTQHEARQNKKQLDPQAWLLTVFKYLFIGNEALKQGGVNDKARKLLQNSFEELLRYQNVLKELASSKSEVTFQLIRNINESIDNLMEADARLKMEFIPNQNQY